ncbi:MAG: malic enzyme-like NAD(P)-binding protein [Candidatus Peregrinibacteria bacterium]|nr:malic enzyme-like NAD(P)-binding protein [Candidatus Peregrinibacteria bacterium]MDZ4245156.1 malic enzyme-like NAD(P)-binding protein [Candidatus Gracilibacteria bacterium]
MTDYFQRSLEEHERTKGKISLVSKMPVTNKDELSVAYTPGVAEPCRRIAENPDDVYKYTSKGNMVAVVSDGSAVLGLGNIGGAAGLPVMEGKAVLFKAFADVDAFPICLSTQDPDEIIAVVKAIAPTFGGINLEDIKAPECFYIEEKLKGMLDIPVFHDDQHGTAIVVLAGLINAMKVTGQKIENLKFVVSGVGAAGVAITKLLILYGATAENFLLCDSKGTIYKGREDLNPTKMELADITNTACHIDHDHGNCVTGGLSEAIKGANVFIGVSKAGLLTEDMVKTMAKDAIIFAMANPTPEIMPDIAKEAGARIVATGRSDFPNQINNVLAFPGIFRGVLDARAPQITEDMKIAAAEAIAGMVENPTEDRIVPAPFEPGIADKVAEAVKAVA